MEVIHKVKVEDKARIKNIKFKFPELMDTDALNLIKDEYYTLQETESELHSARETVRSLEKKLAEMEKKWDAKKDLFEIEFESHEKEVKTTKSYMTINGAVVYDCNKRR